MTSGRGNPNERSLRFVRSARVGRASRSHVGPSHEDFGRCSSGLLPNHDVLGNRHQGGVRQNSPIPFARTMDSRSDGSIQFGGIATCAEGRMHCCGSAVYPSGSVRSNPRRVGTNPLTSNPDFRSNHSQISRHQNVLVTPSRNQTLIDPVAARGCRFMIKCNTNILFVATAPPAFRIPNSIIIIRNSSPSFQ